MAGIPGATYRLWPTTDGPASAAADTTGYSLSTEFEVTGPANFEGFFFWCANGADTTAKAFQLYSLTSGSTGTAVPGTSVTSGVLTQNAWNFVATPAPVALTIGQRYRATVFFAGGSNWYSASGSGWLADLVQGPLKAPSNANALGNIQSGFRVSAGSIDVTHGSVGSNYWVDLLVREAITTAPLAPASVEDTATPLIVSKVAVIPSTAEGSSAGTAAAAKSAVAGAAATEDGAGALVASHRYSLPPATEEVAGGPLPGRKSIPLASAQEAEGAGAVVGAPGLRLLPPAETIDRAGVMLTLKRRPADTLQSSTTGPVLTADTTEPSLTITMTTGGS